MRVLVVGAGALGGYFGACLARAGRDVTFLVRPARAAQLARDGLRVTSPHGDFAVPALTVFQEDLDSPFDLIILAVKAYSLEQAMNAFARAVGLETSIVPVINGISHLDMLSNRFGAGHILGGVAIISATLGQDGAIRHLLPVHELVFGELGSGTSARCRAIADLLGGSGFDSRASDMILQEMWEKWAALATNAGITCLMRAAIGDIVAAPLGAEASLQLFQECCAVAEASGFPLRAPSIERWKRALTEPGSPLKASMLRDIENGSPVEGEHVLGDMAIRAQRFGIATPILNVARTHVGAYEVQRIRLAGA